MPKATEKSSFVAAAARAGVSVGELKLWIAEHMNFSGDRWSKWNSGAEPFPWEYVVDFMRAKREEEKSRATG